MNDGSFQVLKFNLIFKKIAKNKKNSVKVGLETVSFHAPQM